MGLLPVELARRVHKTLIVQASRQTAAKAYFPEYAGSPLEFVKERLHVETLTEPQQQILLALIRKPWKLLVPSGHDTGKTFVAACAIVWWYYTRNPCVILTLGPKYDSLKDTVWAEVRILIARAGLPDEFTGPIKPEMRSSPDHYAKGVTAVKDAAIAGRHKPNMLFVLEEACAVEAVFWTVLKTMFDPSLGHAMLAIFNPTDSSSQAYQEDIGIDESKEPAWARIRLSSLDHPNLTGKGKPIPGAVSMEMVSIWCKDWCQPVEPDTHVATDIEWPPTSGKLWRPGPLFQCRVLGVWPDQGNGVWSDRLFEACLRGEQPLFPLRKFPELGCDMATGKGDDFHAVVARWGAVVLRCETANDMRPKEVSDRIKRLAAELATLVNSCRSSSAAPIKPQQIPIKIDDDGVGGALGSFLMAEGYNTIQVGAGMRAGDPTRYQRKRDELWFAVAERANLGGVYLGALKEDNPDAVRRLRQQLCAPTWEPDVMGRRKLEPKDMTKERIGRSPDDADAFNLAMYEGADYQAPEFIDADPPRQMPSQADAMGLYGRRRTS